MKHELDEIQAAAKRFADRREVLCEVVGIINKAIEEIYRLNAADLRKTVAKVAEAQSELEAMISASPELFESPRSLVFHGIKIGFRKSKGGIVWDDDEQVVKLIKKHFPEKADVLIHTEETPSKTGLAELPAADLKRLAVMITDAGDIAFVKATDTAVDKTVKALLKNATDAAREEAS